MQRGVWEGCMGGLYGRAVWEGCMGGLYGRVCVWEGQESTIGQLNLMLGDSLIHKRHPVLSTFTIISNFSSTTGSWQQP